MAKILPLLLNTIPASVFYVPTLLGRILSPGLEGRCFFFDLTLQFLTLLVVIASMGSTGKILGSNKIPWQYTPWYIAQWSLASASWAFGYIGLNPHVYLPHLVIACLRLVFCSASLAVFVYARLHIRASYEARFILIAVVIAALFHFKVAYDRLQAHRKLQAEVFINPSDYRINGMNGEAMHYSHAMDRDRYRSQAIDAITKTPSNKRFWYHPLAMVNDQEHSPRPANRRSLSNNSETPHFSRCYCCLDSDPRPVTSSSLQATSSSDEDTELLSKQSQWQDQRELFLQQPPQGHPSIIPRPLDAAGIARLGNEFKPHYLCEKCNFMARNSFLIELQSGWTFSTYRKFLSRAFKHEAFVEECFEHWPTPSDMEFQVKVGCHLCTMVWNTMSEEQQQELLSQDSVLEQELHELSSSKMYDQSQLQEIQILYHQQRCIRMKIRSPSAHKAWAGAWKSRHSYQSLRLIPHFGENKVAQRWMEQKLACRAISLDKDPVLEWDKEQDDGLEIACMELDNRGPIVLPISYSTGSDSTMEFIKSWLCEDDHFQDDPKQLLEDFWKPIESDIAFQLLSGSSDSGAQRFRLPTRLIDVGYGDDISVSLRLSSEILNDNSSFRNHGERPDVRYVALSHSWGTLKFVNLTESSLSDFMHGISMGSLPLTFQDAISVVRRVGLRFLWIDSLCIIQDSGEDWRREAVRMKDIYSNAECVIAAAASWTSLDSFFVQQTPLAVNPCLLGVRGHLTDKKGNSPNSFSGIYALPALKYTLDSREDIRLSRLQSRAWCFQEEYLAKKIVYFGDHQVLLSKRRPSGAGVRSVRQAEWQSERETARDTFPDLIHPPIFKVTKSVLQEAIAPHALFRSVAEWNHRRRFHRSNRMANLLKKPIAPANRSDLDEGVYSASYLLTSRWWAVVVTNYSNRFLTRWEDKLQALSGVALRYQSQALSQGVEVHYVAGLWGDCNSYLVTGLLWYVSRHSRGPSLEQYRAPSWSWASVDGLVRNDSLSGCCSVDCAGISILQCSVEGPDVKEESQIEFPIGLCNGGFIVVRGMIQKAHWDILPEVDKRYYVEQAGRDLSIYDAMDLDELAPYSRDPMSGPEAYPLFSKSDVRVGYFLPDAKQGIPKEIFCLRIVVKPDSQAKQEDFSIPWATRGLALTTTGYGSNEFRRVGYFEIDKTLGGLSFLNKFSRSSNRRRAFRSPAPNIDLANFFSGCKEQEIVIR